jgi:polyferredoxin
MLLLMPDLRPVAGLLYLYKVTLLVLVVFWSIAAFRPFCRTLCPLGAFYGLFNRISLIRLKFDADNCTKCGACQRVCPVGIRVFESPNSGECIRCLRCSTEACQFDALSLEIAGHVLQMRTTPPDEPVQHMGRS